MQNLWKCVMCFAVILSIINVVIGSHLITVHVDLDGKVTETAPKHDEYEYKPEGVVQAKHSFDGITDTGVLGSIQKWLKMDGVIFEPLSVIGVQKNAEDSEVDIWADGLRLITYRAHKNSDGQVEEKRNFIAENNEGKKSIEHLKNAVESQVSKQLMAKVFGNEMPKKVQFGVYMYDYTHKAVTAEDHLSPKVGINFRVILKKVETGQDAAQNGNTAQHVKSGKIPPGQ